jgi:hypothetical protein
MIRTRPQRGSALLLVIILLGILTAIGAAAVTLSSRDRINAGAKTRRDFMLACANAAQLKVWAELNRYGTKWFQPGAFQATELVLADGTRLAPLHYGQDTSTYISDVVVTFNDPMNSEVAVDLTNRSGGLMAFGSGRRTIARCVVPGGLFSPDRVLEVEFAIRLATQ